MAKFIFITGGVVSSLGKGINGSSIGMLLKNRGYKVFMQKFDPYLNVTPRNMSPLQHGEVFVTDDGAETDLDLGHYERFIDVDLSKHSSVTTGKVYLKVIEQERNNEFGGRTIQVIPHITNMIKEYVYNAAKYSGADFVITEIGGTVGDIEGLPFLEAIRQVRIEQGFNNTFFVHNTLVPYLESSKELKTKPTQHSVKELRSIGINPDMIILRSSKKVSSEERDKIALFCDVKKESVIEAIDVKSIYEIPLSFAKQHADEIVLNHCGLEVKPIDLTHLNEIRKKVSEAKQKLYVPFIAPFVALRDAYISISEAFKHAGYALGYDVEFKYIDPLTTTKEEITKTVEEFGGYVIGPDFESKAREIEVMVLKEFKNSHLPFLTIGEGTMALFEAYENRKPNTVSHWRIGGRDLDVDPKTHIYKIYENEKVRERFYTNLNVEDQEAPKGMKNCVWYLKEPVAYEKEKGFGYGFYYNPALISRPLRPRKLFIEFLKEVARIQLKA